MLFKKFAATYNWLLGIRVFGLKDFQNPFVLFHKHLHESWAVNVTTVIFKSVQIESLNLSKWNFKIIQQKDTS